MSRAPDRKKLRREYLRKKATGYLMSRMSVALPVMAIVAIVTSAIYEEQHITGAVAVIFIAASALMVGLIALKMSGHAELASRAPYVPPVTPSILPAEEILVRSAEQPDAPQEALLRPTQAHEETAPTQLLRVVAGAEEKPAG